MTLEMIDPYWYALAFVFIGSIAAVILPYLMKLLDDPELSFSYSYFMNLVITTIFAAMVLVPDPVPELVGRNVTLLILAGYGVQTATNICVTRLRKGC